MRKKATLITLGCAKNLVDSEVIAGVLAKNNWELTTDKEKADLILINTCCFIEAAKKESIETIMEIVYNKNKNQKLAVAGCMVNRYAKILAQEIPEIDFIIGIDEIDKIDKIISKEKYLTSTSSISTTILSSYTPRIVSTGIYAYIKIAEGCNNPCTFCAIPLWRGRFRSRSIEDILREAKNLEAQGIKEICLVAQDTTRYGEDLGLGREGLYILVSELLEKTTIPWIRFLYAYPKTLDINLIKLMKNDERFCSYLDIPLQHVSKKILRFMRRGGSFHEYKRMIEQIREIEPNISIRTTFIVGFPGEKEEDFEQLLEFVRQMQLESVTGFIYSEEEGTPAATLTDKVDKKTAKARLTQLLETQRSAAIQTKKRFLGEEIKILIEGQSEESQYLFKGRSYFMGPDDIDGYILVTGTNIKQPGFVNGKITKVWEDGMYAIAV